ncbi:hypothetical protein KC950_01765, partial [Candidatus Saccharibacteria bacterium]|nr:hypothetical protein [Candidatus Saccharibacteria bacterium]
KTRDLMWDWVEDNWDNIVKKLNKSKSYDYLPVYIAGAVTDEKGQKKYREFFKLKMNDKSLTKNIAVGEADIEARIAWRKRDEQKIKDFFKDQLKKK